MRSERHAITTFRTAMPVAETMAFENVYEPALRMEFDEKVSVIADGIALWMFVDGELAGETYGFSPARTGDVFEDCDNTDRDLMYCSSTTLLPPFQGRGLSKILCAYWLGLVRASGYRIVAGHTTSPAMEAVKASFGAVFGAQHAGWCGSQRTARYYEIRL